MAGATRIGGISFGVSMRTKKLNRNIKTARSKIQDFVKGVAKLTAGFGALGVAIGAAAFVTFTKQAFDAIDSLAKTSDKLGVTTKALAGLRLAAEETGASAAVMDKALTNLTKASSEAAQGVGEGIRAFKMLGLNAQKLNQLSPDKQFEKVAEAVANLKNKQDQLTVATQLFGTRGATLINTLRLGKVGLDEAANAADTLGLAIGREAARGVERAIDAFGRLKSAIKGIFQSVAVEVAPLIEGLTKGITDFIAKGGKGKAVGKAIGQSLLNIGKVAVKVLVKMSASFLRFTAIGIDFFNNTQSALSSISFFAKAGFKGPSDKALKLPFQLRKAAFDLTNPRKGEGVTAFIDAAIKKLETSKTADAKKKEIATSAFSSVESIFQSAIKSGKGVLGNLLKTPKQIAKGIQNDPFNQLLSGLFQKLNSNFKTSAIPATAGMATVDSPGLATAGSAEAFRKRVAIQNKNPAIKIAKDSNKKLGEIVEELKKTQQQTSTISGLELSLASLAQSGVL